MLSLRRRRDLDLDPREHPRGQAHLSSASGLVRAGLRCYVVADDEHHLGVFGPDDTLPVALLRVFEGDLPAPKKRRKALKPDLEALLALPAAPAWPAGALLGIGSGSRPNRCRGALLPLADDGRAAGPAQALDLDRLYAPLREELGPLNLEGGFCGADECCLLQRGNGAGGVNAAIAYDAGALLAWLAAPGGAPPRPLSIAGYALGAIAGVPLGFTDGAALPGGAWMFSAVAEATDDSYLDGACVGSAIGFVAADGLLGRIHLLDGSPKVEGLCGGVAAGRLHLMAVTDADDPRRASQLLCGEAEFGSELTGAAAPR